MQSCDPDDYAVLQDGKVVGRIVKVSLAGSEHRWTWSFTRSGYSLREIVQFSFSRIYERSLGPLKLLAPSSSDRLDEDSRMAGDLPAD